MHFRSLPFLVSNSGSSSSSSSEIVPRFEGQTQQSTKLDKDVVSNEKECANFPNPRTVLKTPQDVLQPSSRFCAKAGATPLREVSNSSSSTSSERPFMGLEHQKQLGKRNINTLPPEMDNVQPTFFTAAARIKIQKNMSGSSLKPLEAR